MRKKKYILEILATKLSHVLSSVSIKRQYFGRFTFNGRKKKYVENVISGRKDPISQRNTIYSSFFLVQLKI